MATPLNTGGIGESDPVPESTFPIVQGSVVVGEFANSVSWTERLDTFSQFPIGQMVGNVLRQDQIEGLDKVAFAAYQLGRVVYTPLTATTGAFSTTGSAAAVAGAVMGPSHVRDITDRLRGSGGSPVPPLLDADYMCIAHIDHVRGLKDSNEFIEVSKYAQPERIFRSEIGRYAGARFVEENNAFTSPAGTNSVGFASGIYFGSDNVLEAVAQAPHLRLGIPVDFGRDRREGSFYMGGFSIVWRFDSDSEEHQVRADSL